MPLTRLGAWGLGCAQLGNLYTAMSDENATATVDRAWQEGVRYFDTAPHYGLGLSERRLGAALAAYPRDEFVVSTKVGRLLEPDPAGAARRDDQGFDVPAANRRVWDFSRDGVLRSLEESLRRLCLDRVDIAYVHDPDEHFAAALDGALPALLELRDQGVLGAVGVGMNQAAMPAEFVRRTELDVVLVAGRYTLLDQSALAGLLPLCRARGVAVVAAGVFNGGLLATPSPGTMYDYAPASPAVVAKARHVAEVCAAHGVDLPRAAIALPAGHPAVTSVVLGAHSPAQVSANLARARQPVPPAVWSSLAEAGLLRADAVSAAEV